MDNNQQQNNSKFAPVYYWITLHQFYCKQSTMQVKLLDSNATVQLSIAPSLNSNAGRPQAGVASYDYKSAINFNLTLGEVQTLINAIEHGIINTETVSLFHNFEGGNSILNLQRSQNGALGISLNKGGANVWYSFQVAKANQKSNTVIPYEIELFVSILKSILINLVNIKSKHVYEVVTMSNNNNGSNRGKYNNNGNGGYYNQGSQNNNYQQPQQNTYQQQQPQQNNNYYQQSQQQNNGLPQSNNVAQPNNSMYENSDEF